MLRGGALERRFEKRARSRPVAYAAEIGDDGLVLGAGTILARMTRDSFGEPALDLEEDDCRLCALLAAAHGRPMSPDLPRHLGEAFAHWRRGDRALANIRLAFARIPRLDDRSDAYRLFLAEELLDAGMSPAALMKGLGFDAPARGLAKYDPNQPRVPAGSGKNSGRWGSGGGAAQAPAPAAIIPTPAIASPPVVAAARAASALRAIAYQEQISRLNNPQRPLPAGMAVSLKNPLTGKNVAFDDCRESDGTMIEAKGPGYYGPDEIRFLGR